MSRSPDQQRPWQVLSPRSAFISHKDEPEIASEYQPHYHRTPSDCSAIPAYTLTFICVNHHRLRRPLQKLDSFHLVIWSKEQIIRSLKGRPAGWKVIEIRIQLSNSRPMWRYSLLLPNSRTAMIPSVSRLCHQLQFAQRWLFRKL